ncbi:MAG: hypothetical protein ABW007_27115 [Chitinophagaceae bacterium]
MTIYVTNKLNGLSLRDFALETGGKELSTEETLVCLTKFKKQDFSSGFVVCQAPYNLAILDSERDLLPSGFGGKPLFNLSIDIMKAVINTASNKDELLSRHKIFFNELCGIIPL